MSPWWILRWWGTCGRRSVAAAEHLAEILLSFARGRAHQWVESDLGFQREKLIGEIRTGQWVIEVDPHGALLGFMSWYRCNDDVLECLMDDDWEWMMTHHSINECLRGPNLYLTTAITAPWAPRMVLRRLTRAVRDLNADAVTLAWKHWKRGDPRPARFRQMPVRARMEVAA